VQLDARHRMRETEHRRVQGLPGETRDAGLGGGWEPRRFALEARGIDGVAKDRMAYMCHVDADLMGSSRLQPATNKACYASKALNDPPMGQRAAAAPGGRVVGLDLTPEMLTAARRAGRAVAGFVKVEQMIGRQRAGLLIVADEAQGDGLGKLQASGLPIARLGDAAALGGIFGREQTVYAAVARDDAGGEFIERIEVGAARWRGYRLNSTG